MGEKRGEQKAHVFFSGRVQGVFFRAFTEDVARGLGLSGWVRNVPDGRVEALFVGDKEKVMQAINKCQQGPPASQVDNVEVDWDSGLGESGPFKVVYY
jgi:acylphosphatase